MFRVARVTYDANGTLLTGHDPLGHTATHTYEARNRLATRTDPTTRTEAFTDDLARNRQTVTDRKAQVTTEIYDAADVALIAGPAAVEGLLPPAAGADAAEAHSGPGGSRSAPIVELQRFGRNETNDEQAMPGLDPEAADVRVASELCALAGRQRRNLETARVVAAASSFSLGSLDGNATLTGYGRGGATGRTMPPVTPASDNP